MMTVGDTLQRASDGSRTITFLRRVVAGSVVCVPVVWLVRTLRVAQVRVARGLGARQSTQRMTMAAVSMSRLVESSWLLARATAAATALTVAAMRATPASLLATVHGVSAFQTLAVTMVVAVATHAAIGAMLGLAVGWFVWAVRFAMVALAALVLAHPQRWADAWAASALRHFLREASRLAIEDGAEKETASGRAQ